MPELPEVETVRRGLAAQVEGRRLRHPQVEHPRTVRRQPGGAEAFRALTSDRDVTAVSRRGKYLWLTLDGGPDVVVAHLGMSGQFRLAVPAEHAEHDPHRRAWWSLDDGTLLVFRDQRTFGWLLAEELTEAGVPRSVAHIAPDLFEDAYDEAAVVRRIGASSSGIKRILLAQTVVSGIGNIYADEALWRARVHPEHPGNRLSARRVAAVLAGAREVMAAALAAGGTSFDPLYVSVNGESGWFDRSLSVYGRGGEPCPRCGRPLVRERFTNRSSHRCPSCQRLPRRRSTVLSS